MDSSHDTSIEDADGELPSGGRLTSQLSAPFQPLYSAQASVLKNFKDNNPHNQFTHPAFENPTCSFPGNITSLQMEGCDAMIQLSGLHQPMQAMFWPLVESQPSLSLDQSPRLIDVDDQYLTCDQGFGWDLDFQMGLSNHIVPALGLPQPPQAWPGPLACTYGQSNTTMSSSNLDQSTFGPLTLPQNASDLGATPSSFVTQHQLEAENLAKQSFGAAQPAPRKRAPKASTMSAKKWEPAESRIRQLFLDEERSYKEVMDIVNQEFGFTAT